MPRATPSGNPLIDLPVTGRMWLDDATRPAGFCRFAVNVVTGGVRAGSVYDDVLANTLSNGSAHPIMPGGMYHYRTPQGAYYTIILRGTTDPRVNVVRGSRVVFSGQLTTSAPRAATPTYHTNAMASSAQIPVTWGRIGNKVVFAGPFEGRIGVVEFKRSGRPEFRIARAHDRTVEKFNAADDAGPYARSAPYAMALTVHQGRVIVADRDGVVHFSNLNDPDGWPYNNRFYLQDGLGSERATSLASVAEGNLLVSQRDGFWVVQGDLGDIATTTVARRTTFGRGNVAPAALRVTEQGVAIGLAEDGPFFWVNGTYIPASGQVSTTGGSLGALFDSSHVDDLDIDRYRPQASALAGAVARYSRRRQMYEVAVGALVESGDIIENRRLRLCCHVPTRRWWLEVHPPTRALLAAYDGREGEVLLRGDDRGTVFFEGVGDHDQENVAAVITNRVIPARLQTPLIDMTPERARARKVWPVLARDWTASVQVAVLPDGRSAESEGNVSAPAETRTRAFSTDSTSIGFVLGTDALEGDMSTPRLARGLPPIAAGRRVRLEFRTESGAASGTRWALRQAHIELAGGGRTG